MISRFIVSGPNYIGKVTIDKQDALRAKAEHPGSIILEEHVMPTGNVIKVGEVTH